jgi:tRNA-dihydrouridine synthase
MIRQIDFAPLDGITKVVYRRVWEKHFGGVDRYFIPFFSPTDHHIITPRDFRELDPAANQGLPSVPQIMSCKAPDFIWAAEQMAELGYTEVNLNLGCPSGTVTAKGKGAGFLARREELDRFFDEVFAKVQIPVSVKTRLGIVDPEEFGRILEIYNRYPICCLTIHPRVQKEKYRGEIHFEQFAQALESSPNPICFNGDLRTVAEVRTFEERFPTVDCAMIGRGLVADPALARKLRGGKAATREELQAFTQDLYQSYQEFYGQVGTAAQRMREIWFYLIHMFEDADRLNKKLRRFKNPGEYETAEAAIFAELELRQDSVGDLI